MKKKSKRNIIKSPLKVPAEDLIKELWRIADLMKKNSVSIAEFMRHRSSDPFPYGVNRYHRMFGNWSKACVAAGLEPNLNARTEFIRKRVSPQRKLDVMNRDFHKCAICGASPAIDPCVLLQIDHILPVAKGGSSEMDNLWCLCRGCNYSKAANVDPWISYIAEKHIARGEMRIHTSNWIKESIRAWLAHLRAEGVLKITPVHEI